MNFTSGITLQLRKAATPSARSALRLISNSLFMLATTAVGSIFGFAFWLAVAHSYAPREVGLGAALVSAATFAAAISELGLGQAVMRFCRTLDDGAGQLVNSAFTLLTLATLLTTLIYALGTPIWSPTLSFIGRPSYPMLIFVATAVLLALAQLVDKVFIGYEAAHLVFVRNIAANILRIVAALTVFHQWRVDGLVLSLALSSLITFALSAAMLPRVIPDYSLTIEFHWHLLRDKMSYSLANHIGGLLWSAPALVYPLIVVAVLGPAANAEFYISWMIANVLYAIPTAAFTAVMVRAAARPDVARKLRLRADIIVMSMLILLAAILSLVGPWLLTIFGHAYHKSGFLLFDVLLVAVLPYALVTSEMNWQRVMLASRRVVQLTATSTIASLALSLLLAHHFGIIGIGLGWLLGQTIGAFAVLTLRIAHP
jgi:O-antigen/teichoic acid export membrane protein